MYAYFDVDERTYLDLVGESPSATRSTRLKERKLPVLMRLANAEEFTHAGHVDFLDSRLSGNSGSIRMRAVFPNPRETLKSGLFVRIRLPISEAHPALLIADEALQSDQGRKYVYVVKTVDGKEIVDYRPVVPGQAINGLREIKPTKRNNAGEIVEGLDRGERVIISGMQRVRAKTQVHTKLQDPPNPPGAPLKKLLADEQAALQNKCS